MVAHDEGMEVWENEFFLYGFSDNILNESFNSGDVLEHMLVLLAYFALDDDRG